MSARRVKLVHKPVDKVPEINPNAPPAVEDGGRVTLAMDNQYRAVLYRTRELMEEKFGRPYSASETIRVAVNLLLDFLVTAQDTK